MELSYNEKLLLALHLELFNKQYDTNNNMIYGVVGNSMLVRHVKMQNVCYLFKNLGIDIESFSFSQNGYCPYSPGLEALLIDLDKKEDNNSSISSFYKEYNEKRNEYYSNYKNQLNRLLCRYLDENQIETVSKACYLLEDIVSQQMGSETISQIIYLSKTLYPQEDFSEIYRKLTKRNKLYEGNQAPELAQEIWKCLTVLGIIRMEPKKLKNGEKILQKNNKPLN